MTRLLDNLYPRKIDRFKDGGTAMNRFFSMENRLQHPRNAKLRTGVQERINDLIQDGMMIDVGTWEQHKH